MALLLPSCASGTRLRLKSLSKGFVPAAAGAEVVGDWWKAYFQSLITLYVLQETLASQVTDPCKTLQEDMCCVVVGPYM